MFEIIGGHLHFILMIDITIANRTVRSFRPYQVKYTFDLLQVHGDAFQPIGQLTAYRSAFQATDLLEIGKLRDFHAV